MKALNADIAVLTGKLDKVKAHRQSTVKEQKIIGEALDNAKKTFTKSIHDVHRMINKTNTSVARLTRTQLPVPPEDYLKQARTVKAGTRASTRGSATASR